MQLLAGLADAATCRGGLVQRGVVVEGAGSLRAARANVDGALVGGVPVAGLGRLVGEREVGLDLVDLGLLVVVVLEDGLDAELVSTAAD